MFDGTSFGCCPSKPYTCSLSPDKGVQCGSGRSFRYYFNPHKQTCESFQYEGCDGNSNSFLSIEDCQDYCGVGGCPNSGQPLRDLATNQFTTCSESVSCPASHDCVTINFNGNVAQRCCPSKAHICSLPPSAGNQCTKNTISRYYFNIVTKECGKFQYNGCNGNLNNFQSIQECVSFCSSSACAPGEITYKDANVRKVVECVPTVINGCPLDFVCKYHPLTTKHVCCGTPPSDVCPDGEKAYINPLDESVKECTINIAGSCPSGFLCRFSSIHNRYYCCASRSGNVCPDGKALYRQQKTLQPTRCTLSSPHSQCSEGYSCQSRVPDVLQGYCCSSQNVCRGNSEFLIDEKTKMPKVCILGAFGTCPVGYRCSKSQNSLTGYCCKGDVAAVTEGCPKDLPYAYTRQREIISCDPFNPQDKECPAQYSCQYALSHQRYQCCGKEPVDEEEQELAGQESGCLNDQVAYFSPGSKIPQVCTASGPNTCPLGYFCQFSDKNKQFQCCAQKAGCPNAGVAYVGISGEPESCKAALVDTCPSGFSCQQTSGSKYVCCTTKDPKESESTDTSSTNILTETTESSTQVETTTEANSQSNSNSIKFKTKTKNMKRPLENLKPLPSEQCQPNEQLRNNICVALKIGDSCSSTDQCPKTSVCLLQICRCPEGTRQDNDVCVSDLEEAEPVRKSNSVSNEIKDSKTRKCKVDEILYKGHCLKKAYLGEVCVTRDQCQNGAICYRGKCRCESNMAAYKSICLENICGGNQFRLPELDANTSVVQCADNSQICRVPHRCIFSKIIDDYICCKSTNANRQSPSTPNLESLFFTTTYRPLQQPTSRARRQCPNNEIPLLFPNTNQPIKCTAYRPCPKGYFCAHNICCKEAFTTQSPSTEPDEED